MGNRIVNKDQMRNGIAALWRAGIRGGSHPHYFEALTDFAVAFGVNIDGLPEPHHVPTWEPWTEPRKLEWIARDDTQQS